MDITVVIPARNAGPFLPTTLASIAAQTLAPKEVIVVDDGSTDATAEIAEDHGARVIAERGGGAANALNRGIDAATTELIAHFDADDLMLPTKLAQQHRCFEGDESRRLGLVSSDLQMFDEQSDDPQTFLERGVRRLPDGLAEGFRVDNQGSAFGEHQRWPPDESARFLGHAHLIDVKGLYRRSAWQAVGGFDSSYRCAYDMDFVWRVSRRYDIGIVHQVLFRGRRHRRNLSGDPTLVAHECSRLFRQMLRDSSTATEKSKLRERRRRELRDIAWIHWKDRHLAKSARYYLQATVA